ncbi:MAG: PQQ-binding-like beta-propeller repeat protein [Candidatus Brocadiia bacterium]
MTHKRFSVLLVALLVLSAAQWGCCPAPPDPSTYPETIVGIAAAGDALIASTSKGAILGLDRKDLTVLWRTELPSRDFTILEGSTDAVFAFQQSGEVTRVLKDGQVAWTIKPSAGIGELFAIGKTVLFCKEEILTAFDPETGAPLWESRIPGLSSYSILGLLFFDEFIAFGEFIAIAHRDGVTCVRLSDGQPLWSAPCKKITSMAYDPEADALVVAIGKTIQWLDAKTGSVVRQLKLRSKISALAVLPSSLLTVTDGRDFALLDKTTGFLQKDLAIRNRGHFRMLVEAGTDPEDLRRPDLWVYRWPGNGIGVMDINRRKDYGPEGLPYSLECVVLLDNEVFFLEFIQQTIVRADLATLEATMVRDPLHPENEILLEDFMYW